MIVELKFNKSIYEYVNMSNTLIINDKEWEMIYY